MFTHCTKESILNNFILLIAAPKQYIGVRLGAIGQANYFLKLRVIYFIFLVINFQSPFYRNIVLQ